MKEEEDMAVVWGGTPRSLHCLGLSSSVSCAFSYLLPLPSLPSSPVPLVPTPPLLPLSQVRLIASSPSLECVDLTGGAPELNPLFR